MNKERQIANRFYEMYQTKYGEKIDQMKLHKLMYFAQRENLVVNDIPLFDDDGSTALAVWTLVNAWPSKYTAPDFNASSSEIAFESVELVYESMTRES